MKVCAQVTESLANPARVAVVGMSEAQICGARDHARLLLEAMEDDGHDQCMCWLSRRQPSLLAGYKETRSWARQLATTIEGDRVDAVVLHYSVFACSYRGVPIFVLPLLSALRRTGLPVVAILHEFAYDWGRGGWRGTLWALTQRIALVPIVRRSAALLVTTESRDRWLASRRWLPRRLTMVAPVFSNLPAPRTRLRDDAHSPVLGMFGYSYESVAASSVLDAIALMRQRGSRLTLRLLGAPGRKSATAEAWLAAAAARGLQHIVEFSGILSAQDLSDALASCTVLLFADRAGPASRNGTLAASVASGVPLVAIDGPDCWPELRHFEVARVVPPTSQALADAIRDLLTDDDLREKLGAHGRAFAEREMSVARTAIAVTKLLRGVGRK